MSAWHPSQQRHPGVSRKCYDEAIRQRCFNARWCSGWVTSWAP